MLLLSRIIYRAGGTGGGQGGNVADLEAKPVPSNNLIQTSLPYADFGTALSKICVSGTVGGPLLEQKFPSCVYISQKLW